MRPLWYRLKNKDGKKRRLSGKLKVKFMMYVVKAMFMFFKVILPVVVLASLAFIINSWVEDVYQSKNDPKYLYEVIGKEDLNELIAVAGNEEDGYYLAYKEGLDEKLDEAVKKYERIGYSYINKEILLNMIKAELITQYPNLGGKIGHEAKIDETAVSNSANMLGVLKWPTDSTQISSHFGNRTAPTQGASTYHKGIDISVSEGTNVYACEAGKVTVSQYSDSAGNYVEIDHGNGYVSKYMHNSGLKVSVGDQVQKGQVIAVSGSTGISTGPHLHFQIEKDGNAVDPETFKYDNGTGQGTESSFAGASITSLEGFLFVGDSITDGMREYKVADDEVTFKAKIGIGSKYWLDNFDSLTEKSDIKGINILLGTNDYDYATNYMKQLLDKLHEKYPNITIYVDKLLPDLSSDVDSTKREQYMSDIKSYCEGKSYLVYIDPTSGVNMGKGDCHPATEEDYKTLWNNIKKEIMNSGNKSSEDYVPPLIIGEDTGEGSEGFQGAIRIRRVTPNKEIGELINTGVGDVVSGGSSEVVTTTKDGLGKKEGIPENIKKQMEGVSMRHLSGITYDELSYLTIPYYDFNGNVQQGHMVVNAKIADEVLLIFQELYKIKYPIEKMEIVDNYSGSNGYVGDDLDYASIEANNTSAFNDRQVITPDGTGSGFSVHAKGQAIDINPKINPYIRADRTSAHANAKKYNTNRDTKEGWTNVEKAACITKNSEIYKIFTKYGWTWLGNDDNTGDTQHFEKADASNVKTIDYNALENDSKNENKNNSKTETDKNNENSDTNNKSSTSDTNATLSNQVKDYVSNKATSGTWSVYAKNLKTNSVKVNINDQKMQSASVIKLFIMATAYQKMSEGVTINNAEALIEKMITVSDNDSTNNLIRQLGMDTINQYISSNGYSNTELHREMLASTANGDNYTSVSDVTKILERIYKGECVNKEASEKMLKYLKAQQRTGKIPAGVPSGVDTANKTGELSTVENDAAIVYKENEPYILVVMSSDLSDTAKARENIVEISKMVYEQIGTSGDAEATHTESASGVSSSVNSKIYDLKYIPEEEFNKKLNDQDPTILQYYTLDGNWKLIVASWSYSSDEGVKYTKNSPINYKSALKKYITPIEYLMDYYINIKEEDFINDFMDLIYNSEFIIAVQDNVNTTETKTDISISYDDGTTGESSSEYRIDETVRTGVEVTYVDTWFVKFSKKTSYSTASFESVGGSLTGKAGDLVGEYKTTTYCYVCNDDGNGNFGTSVTASGAVATPHRTVAIHNADTGGDPNGLKLGDKIMIEGDPTVYVVEDTGAGQAGAWLDIFVEATGTNRGNCCINSEYGDRTVKVYLAEDVQEVSGNNLNSNGTNKFINTVANVAGKVTETNSTSSTSESGPVKTIFDKDDHGYHYIGSTKFITTSIHSIDVQYDNGDSEISSNEEKFLKLFKDNPKALNRIKGKWLITLVSRNSRTTPFLDLTKYLMYKLLGHNYGVTEFDFSIYEPDAFTSMNSSGGREQFIRWLHEWEGLNGSITADGKKYIIGDDGYGHPTVGYGIDIFNGGFADRFRAAGYSTDIGAEVDKEFVDNLEKEEIDKAIETVEAKCAGLNLTQYQKYALVSRIFNCGASGAFTTRNGKDFIAAYTAYWNADTDNEYKVPANESMFSHPLYSTYMCKPNTSNNQFSQGLVNRRRAEWLLFKTGYYDKINEYYEDGGDIVNVADKVHKYIEQNGYYYSLGGDLPGSVKDVKNVRAVCCATFVSWTLYEAGYDWMEECPGINSCESLLPFLESHGGQKILKPTMSDLKPGDILFYGSGGGAHTDIYAGDGMWYNCGGNDSVKGSSPYAKGVRSDVYCAIRFN